MTKKDWIDVIRTIQNLLVAVTFGYPKNSKKREFWEEFSFPTVLIINRKHSSNHDYLTKGIMRNLLHTTYDFYFPEP